METCPTAHKPHVLSVPHDSILLSIRRCLNRQSYLSGIGSAPHHTNHTCRLGGWVLRCTDPIIYMRTTHGDTRYGLERGGGTANGAGTASGLWGPPGVARHNCSCQPWHSGSGSWGGAPLRTKCITTIIGSAHWLIN